MRDRSTTKLVDRDEVLPAEHLASFLVFIGAEERWTWQLSPTARFSRYYLMQWLQRLSAYKLGVSDHANFSAGVLWSSGDATCWAVRFPWPPIRIPSYEARAALAVTHLLAYLAACQIEENLLIATGQLVPHGQR